MKVSSFFYIKTVSLKRIYKTSVKIFKEKKWLLDLKYRSLCKYLEIDHQITAGAEIRIINALLLLTHNVTSGPESPAAFSFLGIDISVCVTRVNGYLAGINILVTLLTTYTTTPTATHYN